MDSGLWNAKKAMDRACDVAKRVREVGCCVAIGNNHWMRAVHMDGSPADHGCIGVCWSKQQCLEHAGMGAA